MEPNQLLSALSKLSIQLIFIKIAIPELESFLNKNRIKVEGYSIECWDNKINITGKFLGDESKKIGMLRDKLIEMFPESKSNCGNSGFTIMSK